MRRSGPVDDLRMSPTSRGRRRRKGNHGNPGRRSTPRGFGSRPHSPGTHPLCLCPRCANDDVPGAGPIVSGLLSTGAWLRERTDPLDAEAAGSVIAARYRRPDGQPTRLFVDEVLPRVTAAANTEALAILLAIGAATPESTGEAARTSATVLAAAGVPAPSWADELAEPITATGFRLLRRTTGLAAGKTAVLGGEFVRAGRRHILAVRLNPLRCGEAAGIVTLRTDLGLDRAIAQVQAGATRDAAGLGGKELDAAEFRWEVSEALAIRAAHEAADLLLGFRPSSDPHGQDVPGYHATALLLTGRLQALPTLRHQPPRPHTAACDELIRIVARRSPTRHPGPLPARWARQEGPAPLYQITVNMRGARQPIWRRLEVPADLSLARLHAVIQAAFGWQESELHEFETPFGTFTAPDPDGPDPDFPGPAPDWPDTRTVSLGQVLTGVGSQIVGVYLLDNEWELDIELAKISGRTTGASDPRCLDGQRAAPPEGCQSWDVYEEFLRILEGEDADPDSEESYERLTEIGLAEATDFDPRWFDLEAVNADLSRLR